MLIRQRLTIDIPNDGTDPRQAVVGRLMAVGLDEEGARRLVENELTFEPALHIPLLERPITSMERSVAKKLLSITRTGKVEPLTDEEGGVLIVVPIIRATAKKAGFLERAAGYCGSEEVARQMLTQVFKPMPPFRPDCCVVREHCLPLFLAGPRE